MQQNFDYFSKQERPSMTLCNPNLDQIYSLESAYEVELKFKWNALSELSFKFPEEIDGVDLDAYDYIAGKRIVLLGDLGYFLISDVSENSNGSIYIKDVDCVSLDGELVYKKINAFSGTYLLYNSGSPTDPDSLMGHVINLVPNWEIGTVESSLNSIYRTFDVSNSNVYQLLNEEASKSYGCIFDFDYLNRTISIVSSSGSGNETDIFLSFDNLILNTNYNEITDEIATCLYPNGGGDLTIRSVNPLGTNTIYNFDYYKTTSWMSQSLITAIDAWETKFDSYADSYSASAVELGELQTNWLIEQALLAEYEAQLSADQAVRAARLQQGLDTTDIDNQILTDTTYVNDQTIIVDEIVDDISSVTQGMKTVNDLLAFSNTDNFTNAQWLELNNFIFENGFVDNTIIITDSMTETEIQEQTQKLYDKAVETLAKLSIPRYQITINSVNFLALQDYSHFIDQLELGDQITVDTGKGYTITATLLQYEFTYDDPEKFKITLSNRQRLDDSSFIFSDFMGNTIQTTSTVDFNYSNWNDWKNNKSLIVGKVVTPDGIIVYGTKSSNLVGTILAGSSLSIENINSTTGNTNILIDKDGVIIRDPKLYDADGNIGIDATLDMAGGGQIMFRNGIFIGGAGLEPGSNIVTLEDLTGSTGTSFSASSVYLANSLRVYINGVMQRKDYTYAEESDLQSFTMYDSIFSTDHFIIEYVSIGS